VEHTHLEKLIFTQLVKKYPPFIEPEGSLPCSQQLLTGPCPMLDKSSQQFPTLFL